MRTTRCLIVSGLSCLALLAPVSASSAGSVAGAPPTVVDLGTLGGSYSIARDINSAGIVVGASQKAGDVVTRAFRWTTAAGMHGLGTLGGTNSDAQGINDQGLVVGWSDVPGGAHHAFLWQSGVGMRDLGTLGGANSEALSINAAGVVVGMSDMASGFPRHAFIWDAVNGIRDLGFTDAVVRRINDAGQIVGTSANAFVWDPVNGMRDLGNLGGTASIGMTINASGQVAGGADDPITGPDVAVAWSAAGEIRRLGNLPASGPWTAGCCSGGMDINDTGTVVGWALVDGDDVSRAVMWDPVQGIRDLGTLGGEDATANAINNAGKVVGESLTASGLQHATMWTLPTDTTPPTVTCTTPVPNFLLRQSGAKVTAKVTDSGSGPVTATVSAAANTSNVGARTVTLTGTDKAGNTRSVACPYKVGYKVAGGFFRPPVDGNGIVNVARAGKTVPVRWRITDAQGVPVANLTTVTVTWPTTTIGPAAPTDKIEWYTTAAAGLTYVGNGTYQYNWKTPAAFAGTKHQLRLDLGEGKVRTALFRFTT